MTYAILEQLDRYGPRHCPQLDYQQASAYTRQLAAGHYENFTVVSWLLPRRLRDDFRHVYAFCRWADDLGDQIGDPQRSLELLDWWRSELADCYDGKPRHPVFVALRPTIEKHDIPRKPFDDLIDAFCQDQRVSRYRSWDQVLDYCTRSADPVGRLVLYLCGYRDQHRQQLSDATCTALQLANFWQDVRRDVLERDRVYIPDQIAAQHGLDLELMVTAIRADNPTCNTCAPASSVPSAGIHAQLPAYRATMRDLVDRTRPLFVRGRQLWPLVSRDVRPDIKLFTLGGQSILRMIEKLNYNTLQTRPSLSKAKKLSLLLRTLIAHLLSPGGATSVALSSPQPDSHGDHPHG